MSGYYGGTRLYIGHLSSQTTISGLEREFGGYGRLCDVTLKQGYAFVEFKEYQDAVNAMDQLNGLDLDGSLITVEFARGSTRDRSAGPWKCFRCGVTGHYALECMNVNNEPRYSRQGRSYSRSRTPRRRVIKPERDRDVSRSICRSDSPVRGLVQADFPIQATKNHNEELLIDRNDSPVRGLVDSNPIHADINLNQQLAGIDKSIECPDLALVDKNSRMASFFSLSGSDNDSGNDC